MCIPSDRFLSRCPDQPVRWPPCDDRRLATAGTRGEQSSSWAPAKIIGRSTTRSVPYLSGDGPVTVPFVGLGVGGGPGMCVDFVRALLPPVARGMTELHLFNGPYVVVDGEREELPEGSKRLLAYVALHGGYVERRVAAGVAWPVGNDVRAAGNLRSALWRLRGAGIDLIEGDNYTLSLQSGTVIDLDVVCAWAARLIEGRAQADDLDTAGGGPTLSNCCPAGTTTGWCSSGNGFVSASCTGSSPWAATSSALGGTPRPWRSHWPSSVRSRCERARIGC